jgi:phage gp46-like protein
MTDRFQGDPKMILDENGADLVFKGGQPVMDQGLENAALISLHTREGWFGNIFARSPAEKIGSKYEATLEQPITLGTLTAAQNAAQNALQWLIDKKIASSVEAACSNPQGAVIRTVIVVSPLYREATVLLQTKNGSNWVNQKLDPASTRV